MALRMNLYGCSLVAIYEAIGSNSEVLLASASMMVTDLLRDDSERDNAIKWLGTLIQYGYPLKGVRSKPSAPEDGSLLVAHFETEAHILALHCLIQSIRKDNWGDLSERSSHWHRTAISALYKNLATCGCLKSSDCPTALFRCIEVLGNGSPLFGDDFYTDWSYYALIPQQDLIDFVRGLEFAITYAGPFSNDISRHTSDAAVTQLSDDGREFVNELSSWFTEIANLNQDAYVFWS